LKHFFLILVFSFLSHFALGQEVEKDSSVLVKKEIKIEQTENQPKQKKKKHGIGETFLSLGKGFLNRLKYRFNLEAVENKIEKVEEKLKPKEQKEN